MKFTLVLKRRLVQYVAAITASLGYFSIGSILGWPSPTLPKLEAKDSEIPITQDQGSWIVAVIGIAGILAPIFGFFINRFGRKILLCCGGLPALIGWLLIIFARSASELIASRTISGISNTIFFILCPVYIGEIAEEDIRGLLGFLMAAMTQLGVLFSYSVGPYVSVRALGAYSALIPVSLLLLILFMPETPYYLLMKNRRDEAEVCLMKLRGRTREGVQEELQRMQTFVAEQTENRSTIRDLVSSKASRRALIVIIGLNFNQQFCGSIAITSYMQKIFDTTPDFLLSSDQSAILVTTVEAISCIIALLLIDRLGRRPLLMASISGSAIFLIILGTYFYVFTDTKTDNVFSWVPLTCLILFKISVSMGLGPMPMLLMAELFAMNVKGLALSIGMLTNSVSAIVVVKIYQIVTDNLGSYAGNWFFAIFCVFAMVFAILLVPETKGKPFDLIIAQLESRFLQLNNT